MPPRNASVFAAPTTSDAGCTEASNSLMLASLPDSSMMRVLQPLESLLHLGQVVPQDQVGGLEGRTGFVAHRVGVLSVVMDIGAPFSLQDTQPAASVRTTVTPACASSRQGARGPGDRRSCPRPPRSKPRGPPASPAAGDTAPRLPWCGTTRTSAPGKTVCHERLRLGVARQEHVDAASSPRPPARPR